MISISNNAFRSSAMRPSPIMPTSMAERCGNLPPRVSTMVVLLLLSLGTSVAPGQGPPEAGTPEPPIADNSFLIEEAYNQEAGVVQHISVFQRDWRSSAWAYSFTQEWPLG